MQVDSSKFEGIFALIHLRWKFMNEFCKCLGIRIPHFFPQTPHYAIDMCWARIPVDSLRMNRSEPFDTPKVVPLWSKEQWIHAFIPPKRSRVSRIIFFHECLVGVCAMRLGEVLLKNHIPVLLEHLSLVNCYTA